MSSMTAPPITAYGSDSAHNQDFSEADKYVTFKLANYLFALPSEKILKIVPTPSPSQGGMVSMGLVQLEQYSIQTLDLPKMMNLQRENTAISRAGSKQHPMNSPQKESSSSKTSEELVSVEAENPPFLMVMQDAENALWGIAVHEPPDLMDIPQYALKPVPSEKRLTRALRWVSHVVTYDLGSDRHTLLVLDLSVLLATEPNSAKAESNQHIEIEPPILEEPLSQSEQLSDSLIGIEPPLSLSELEVEVETGRKEEMYA